MAANQLKILLLLFLFSIVHVQIYTQTNSKNLIFHTTKSQTVAIHGGSISVNNKNLYKLQYDDIIYSSKRNRLIENSGSTFLFLEINGTPNRNRLYVFSISKDKVDSIAEAISSDIKDLDGDTCLEFGGSDVTEVHPSKDSMYYIPANFYEIRNGRILFDLSLTKAISIELNGIYLSNPLDAEGYCCKAILKPKNKNVVSISNFATDSIILSERIDGPANIRDTINGKLLFILNDNTPVSAADTINNWYLVGILADLTSIQSKTYVIEKGSKIFSNGKIIGRAVENLKLRDVYKNSGKIKGEIVGYTSSENVKPKTIPENVLKEIIKRSPSITTAELKHFMVDFQFTDSKIGRFKGYQLDAGWIYGPSTPLRLWLGFNKGNLFAIVHLRKLNLEGCKLFKLKRGFQLSIVGNQDPRLTEDFIADFNTFIMLAD